MFDITVQNTSIKLGNTNIKFNAVSGTLVKSTSKSKIYRFNMKSERANTFFDLDQPYYIKKVQEIYDDSSWKTYEREIKIEVIILQTMLYGDGEVLIEFIEKKDIEGEEIK